jgi:hypothetical protein
MEFDRLLLIAATAGIWIIVIGGLYRSPAAIDEMNAEVISAGVKAALNDCVIQRNGSFRCP